MMEERMENFKVDYWYDGSPVWEHYRKLCGHTKEEARRRWIEIVPAKSLDEAHQLECEYAKAAEIASRLETWELI
jgi:hypothetical protein